MANGDCPVGASNKARLDGCERRLEGLERHMATVNEHLEKLVSSVERHIIQDEESRKRHDNVTRAMTVIMPSIMAVVLYLLQRFV